MADTRTTETLGDVVAFIAAIEDERKGKDAEALVKLMEKVTGQPPKLWGTIVGFGQYHYKYDSGHEGDTCYVGFAPRKAEFSIYLTGTYFPEQGDARERLLKRLGKHRIGKACL